MNSQSRFIYVSNIPTAYHACHLRNFYSQYIEGSAFVCFHFRHRPQVTFHATDSSIQSSSRHCALLSIKLELCDRFLHPEDELPLSDQCILTPIEFTVQSDQDAYSYALTSALLQLIEFNPPAEMPQGNVGTPSSYFFSQIQLCRLCPTIIKKLHLNFSNDGRQRKYGAVPYSYEPQDSSTVHCSDDIPAFIGDVRSHNGVPILDTEGKIADRFSALQHLVLFLYLSVNTAII
ncbi:unnamed protein product, partial [Echinostoma caproni]|uniref:RRM_8 domain-containing protein n=1 Tax=Echinostoma caproni TaxID=27848 RepID=A0A183A4F6_9TREM